MTSVSRSYLRARVWAAFGIVCLLGAVVSLPVLAQKKSTPAAMPQVDCTECHSCAVPTFNDPCLKTCPRTTMVHQTGQHNVNEAPDSMLIDDIADLYQPVHFNHKLHASMAQMGNDCATCHHYSPPGRIPPCKECHSPEADSRDLAKPNLKGAYHRQCLSCHREWSHDTKCVVCHLPEASGAMAAGEQDPTDIMGIPHPVITVPNKKVYDTPYKSAPIVTFQHKEHVDLFGFRCVDCHAKENCGNCHDIDEPLKGKKTQEEVHAVCNDCHKEDACGKCHDTKERPGFSHGSTGWPLNPYHTHLDCWACHPTGKRIAKLGKMCVNCHSGWNADNFEHAITGIKLDEIHTDLDCTDCHKDRKYEADPVCADCHDDDRTAQSAPPGVKTQHQRR